MKKELKGLLKSQAFQDVVRLVLPRQRRQPPRSGVRPPLSPGADVRHRQRRLRRLPHVRHDGQGPQRQRRRRRCRRKASGLGHRRTAHGGGGGVVSLIETKTVFSRILLCQNGYFIDERRLLCTYVGSLDYRIQSGCSHLLKF